MKKTTQIFLIIVIVFALMTAGAPDLAIAKPDSARATSNLLVAGGSWTSGTDVNVTSLAASAPTWMQLLTDGVITTEPGEICHPFRGGQFGWVGEIRQYIDEQWVKLATTNDWVPNKEGEFMSCAQAPAAGTYALFGYWIRPAGYVENDENPPATCGYSTADWDAEWSNSNEDSTQDIDVSGLQSELNGLTLTLTTVTDPANMLANDTYTTTISGGAANYLEILTLADGSVEFTISVSGCSKLFEITYSVEG